LCYDYVDYPICNVQYVKAVKSILFFCLLNNGLCGKLFDFYTSLIFAACRLK